MEERGLVKPDLSEAVLILEKTSPDQIWGEIWQFPKEKNVIRTFTTYLPDPEYAWVDIVNEHLIEAVIFNIFGGYEPYLDHLIGELRERLEEAGVL